MRALHVALVLVAAGATRLWAACGALLLDMFLTSDRLCLPLSKIRNVILEGFKYGYT